MRQAIVTRYMGPTNFRGSRVKARASAGSIINHWDHADNIDGNHCRAAKSLAAEYGRSGYWAGGGLPTDNGYVFVWAGDKADEPDVYGLENHDWFYIPRKEI